MGRIASTSGADFLVHVPLRGGPLRIDHEATQPIDVALEFPLEDAFGWSDQEAPCPATGEPGYGQDAHGPRPPPALTKEGPMMSKETLMWKVLLVLSLLSAALTGGCGADGTSSGPRVDAATEGGAAEQDPALPDSCAWNSAEDSRCDGQTKPRAVICRASGVALVGRCDYQHSAVGLGNVYCCP